MMSILQWLNFQCYTFMMVRVLWPNCMMLKLSNLRWSTSRSHDGQTFNVKLSNDGKMHVVVVIALYRPSEERLFADRSGRHGTVASERRGVCGIPCVVLRY